jgi:general secretion pathway protein G
MSDTPSSSPPSSPPGYGGSASDRAAAPAGAAPKTSGLAIAGVVVGLAGFCAPVVGGLAGLILGIVAMRQIKRSGGTVGGRGLAIAAIVVSSVTLMVGLLVAFLFGGAAYIFQTRAVHVGEFAAGAQTHARIEVTASALEMYHLDVGRYPTEAEGGLEALRTRPPAAGDAWNGPYLNVEPVDGWGHPLRYEPPDPDRLDDVRGHTYRLGSVGPDGLDGTADDVER